MDATGAPADSLNRVSDELESLDAQPLDEHAAVFGRIHTTLTAALASTAAEHIDSAARTS